jgi:hypothetical protein
VKIEKEQILLLGRAFRIPIERSKRSSSFRRRPQRAMKSCLLILGYSELMAKSALRESDLYKPVERWAKRHFGCFATGVNKGTDYGRVDVVGLRQVPGDLSSDTEFICIEVKKGTQPFLNALGQASAYSIYGDYSYLAEFRPAAPFSEEERVLAERLGIGLIRINGRSEVSLISTARRCTPVENFRLRIADQLGYVRCVVCATYFPRSNGKASWGNLQRHIQSRRRMIESLAEGRGLVFWPDDASRQDVTHTVRHNSDLNYNRRFMCNTCASLFLSPPSIDV